MRYDKWLHLFYKNGKDQMVLQRNASEIGFLMNDDPI